MKRIFTSEKFLHLFAASAVTMAFLGTCLLWWVILSGGNPYHAGNPLIYGQDGAERYQFTRGEWVYVRRAVCLDRSLLTEQSPSLFDLDRKSLFPLPKAAAVSEKGCAIRSSMFQIPYTMPYGLYEYRNISRFQNNLIGRDEANVYPPTQIKIVP